MAPERVEYTVMNAELSLTTPALLFPAISLLMLAYTNRFVVLAQLIRELHAQYLEKSNEHLAGQIYNLQRRIGIIRWMQIFAALSFFFCVASMFLIFSSLMVPAELIFAGSLILLLISLALLVYELQISVHALNIQLSEFSDPANKMACKSNPKTK